MQRAGTADRGHGGHADDAQAVRGPLTSTDRYGVAHVFVQRGQRQCSDHDLVWLLEAVAVEQRGLDQGAGQRQQPLLAP